MSGYTIETFSTGTKYLETACVGSCNRRYRIDEHHPAYVSIKAAMERGDRSLVFCYHKPMM